MPFEAMTSPGHTAGLTVFISMFEFDNRAGIFVEGGSNVDPATGLPVFDGTALFGNQLDIASVSGSAPIFDTVRGAQTFTSSINVAWQGYGSTTTYIESFYVRGADFVMNDRTNATSRSAVATGTITDSTGVTLSGRLSRSAWNPHMVWRHDPG